jgi:hypothetical protein
MKAKKYYIQFKGNDKHADGSPFGHTGNKQEAIKQAKQEAKSWSGHVDFKHGQFEVWSADENGNGQLEHVSACNPSR